MSVSKDSQGDFARTSDSFSNQQKLLGETLAGVGASIAKKLLPHLANLMEKVNTFFAGDWQGKLEKLAPVFAIIGGAILVGLVPALVSMATAAWAAVAPLLPFLAVGAALGGIIYLLIQYFGGWSAVMDGLKKAWKAVTDGFKGDGDPSKLSGPLKVFYEAGEKVGKAFDAIKTAIEPVIATIKDNLTKALEKAQPYVDKIKDSFSKFGDVFTVLGAIIGGATAIIIGTVLGLVNGIVNAIAGFVQMFSGIVSIIQGVF